MSRLLCALVLVAAFCGLLVAAPPAVPPADPAVDRDNNRLPKGATTRLGSLAFRGWTIQSLCFSADGKKLLASSGWEILPWDIETGRPLPQETFSPAGNRTQAGSTLAGDRLMMMEGGAAEFGSTGVPTGAIRVVNRKTGKEISRIPWNGVASFRARHSPLRLPSAAVSADGRYVAIVSFGDKALGVYDADTGKLLHTQKLDDARSTGCLISPDSKTLYFSDGKKPVRRCDLVSGKALPDLADTADSGDFLAASPDGKLVITCGATVEWGAERRPRRVSANVLIVHDAVANKRLGQLELTAYPVHFTFATPEVVLAVTGSARLGRPPEMLLECWSAKTFRVQWSSLAPPCAAGADLRLAISRDNKRVAVTDGEGVVRVYELTKGQLLPTPTGHGFAVEWMAFTPDGARVITAAADGLRKWTRAGVLEGTLTRRDLARQYVRIAGLNDCLVWYEGRDEELVGWDLAKDRVAWRMNMPWRGPELVLSSDGKRCVCLSWGSRDEALNATTYDGPARKKLGTWQLPRVFGETRRNWPALALSPDGATLFVAAGGVGAFDTVKGFDVLTGKETHQFKVDVFRSDASGTATPMVVSPDGTRLAICTSHAPAAGRSLLVFDIKSGKKLVERELGDLPPPALRFSPSGKQLAVWSSWSDTVLVCDARSNEGKPRALEGGNYPATAVAFSPDETNLTVGYQDGTALIWELSNR